MHRAVTTRLLDQKHAGASNRLPIGELGGLPVAVQAVLAGGKLRAFIDFPDLFKSDFEMTMEDLQKPRAGTSMITRLMSALDKAPALQQADLSSLPDLDGQIAFLESQQDAADLTPLIEHARARVHLLEAIVGDITERDRFPEIEEEDLDPSITPRERARLVEKRRRQRRPLQATVDAAVARLETFDRDNSAPTHSELQPASPENHDALQPPIAPTAPAPVEENPLQPDRPAPSGAVGAPRSGSVPETLTDLVPTQTSQAPRRPEAARPERAHAGEAADLPARREDEAPGRPDWRSEASPPLTRKDRADLKRLSAMLNAVPDPHTVETDRDPANLSWEIAAVALDRATGSGLSDLHKDQIAAHTTVYDQFDEALRRRDDAALQELINRHPRHAEALYLSCSREGTVALTGLVFSWDIVVYDAAGRVIDKIDDSHFESWEAAEETARILLDAHPQAATAQVITGNQRYVANVERTVTQAPATPSGDPEPASAPPVTHRWTEQEFRDLAARHGLSVEVRQPSDLVLVASSTAGPGGDTLEIKLRCTTGEVTTSSFRSLRGAQVEAYMRAVAANPSAGSDDVHAWMRRHLDPTSTATEQVAYIRSVHRRAAKQVVDTGRSTYVFVDGLAFVVTDQIPAGGEAYLTLTPDGRWSRRVSGATYVYGKVPEPEEMFSVRDLPAEPAPDAGAPTAERPAAVQAVAVAAQTAATETGETRYLARDHDGSDRWSWATLPPADGVYFTVTASGHWSRHDGAHTLELGKILDGDLPVVLQTTATAVPRPVAAYRLPDTDGRDTVVSAEVLLGRLHEALAADPELSVLVSDAGRIEVIGEPLPTLIATPLGAEQAAAHRPAVRQAIAARYQEWAHRYQRDHSAFTADQQWFLNQMKADAAILHGITPTDLDRTPYTTRGGVDGLLRAFGDEQAVQVLAEFNTAVLALPDLALDADDAARDRADQQEQVVRAAAGDTAVRTYAARHATATPLSDLALFERAMTGHVVSHADGVDTAFLDAYQRGGSYAGSLRQLGNLHVLHLLTQDETWLAQQAAATPPKVPAAGWPRPGDLRTIANRHGLAVKHGITPGGDSIQIMVAPGQPAWAERVGVTYREADGRITIRNGRTLQPGQLEAYLRAYAADPAATPTRLMLHAHAQLSKQDPLSHPEPAATAQVTVVSREEATTAATRAARDGERRFLYCDGDAFLVTDTAPQAAVYLEVTTTGEWSEHRDDATTALASSPTTQDLDRLAGQPDPLPVYPWPWTAEVFRRVAADHGLTVEAAKDWPDELVATASSASRPGVQFAPDTGHVYTATGRLLDQDQGLEYLRRYATRPYELPDELHRQMRRALRAVGGTATGEEADEQVIPNAGQMYVPASSRAEATGRTYYVYKDGRALVATTRMPDDDAAYFIVTPRGHWSRVMDGQIREYGLPPRRQDFSSITGERAAAPGPAETTSPGEPWLIPTPPQVWEVTSSRGRTNMRSDKFAATLHDLIAANPAAEITWNTVSVTATRGEEKLSALPRNDLKAASLPHHADSEASPESEQGRVQRELIDRAIRDHRAQAREQTEPRPARSLFARWFIEQAESGYPGVPAAFADAYVHQPTLRANLAAMTMVRLKQVDRLADDYARHDATLAACRADRVRYAGRAPIGAWVEPEFRFLADTFGLQIIEQGGDLLACSAVPDVPCGVRFEPATGRVLTLRGRVLDYDRVETYLGEYAANPKAATDILYQRVRRAERAYGDTRPDPIEDSLTSPTALASTTATLATATGQTLYVYTDGDPYVISDARPTAGQAFFTLTPAGQWSRTLNGQTRRYTSAPEPRDFEAITGTFAATPPETVRGEPEAAEGDDWTADHQFAAQIAELRHVALGSVDVVSPALWLNLEDFTRTFGRWAYEAVMAMTADDARRKPFGTAFLAEDRAFRDRIVETLAPQVYAALQTWTAHHPLAGPIDVLRQAALADPDLSTSATANYGDYFREFAFAPWIEERLTSATSGDVAELAVAVQQDPGLRVRLTTTLSHEVHVAARTARRTAAADTAAESERALTPGTAPEPTTPDIDDQLPQRPARLTIAELGRIAEAHDLQTRPWPPLDGEEMVAVPGAIFFRVRDGRITIASGGGVGRALHPDQVDAYLTEYVADEEAPPILLWERTQQRLWQDHTDPDRFPDPALVSETTGTAEHAVTTARAAVGQTAGRRYVYPDGDDWTASNGTPVAFGGYLALAPDGTWTVHLPGGVRELAGEPENHDLGEVLIGGGGEVNIAAYARQLGFAITLERNDRFLQILDTRPARDAVVLTHDRENDTITAGNLEELGSGEVAFYLAHCLDHGGNPGTAVTEARNRPVVDRTLRQAGTRDVIVAGPGAEVRDFRAAARRWRAALAREKEDRTFLQGLHTAAQHRSPKDQADLAWDRIDARAVLANAVADRKRCEDRVRACWKAAIDVDGDAVNLSWDQIFADGPIPDVTAKEFPSASAAAKGAGGRANNEQITQYLYQDGDRYLVADVQPIHDAHYSITPDGSWYRHLDGQTRPTGTRAPQDGDITALADRACWNELEADWAAPGWAGSHPLAADIALLWHTARTDPKLARLEHDDPQKLAIDVRDWLKRHVDLLTAQDADRWLPLNHAMTDIAFRASLADLLAAELQATRRPDGTAPTDPASDALVDGERQSGVLPSHVLEELTEHWRTQTRFDVPDGPLRERLGLAAQIDAHLSQLGVPRENRAVTWDREADAFAVTWKRGGEPAWQLLMPDDGALYSVWRGERWADEAGIGRRSTDTPLQAAGAFSLLLERHSLGTPDPASAADEQTRMRAAESPAIDADTATEPTRVTSPDGALGAWHVAGEVDPAPADGARTAEAEQTDLFSLLNDDTLANARGEVTTFDGAGPAPVSGDADSPATTAPITPAPTSAAAAGQDESLVAAAEQGDPIAAARAVLSGGYGNAGDLAAQQVLIADAYTRLRQAIDGGDQPEEIRAIDQDLSSAFGLPNGTADEAARWAEQVARHAGRLGDAAESPLLADLAFEMSGYAATHQARLYATSNLNVVLREAAAVTLDVDAARQRLMAVPYRDADELGEARDRLLRAAAGLPRQPGADDVHDSARQLRAALSQLKTQVDSEELGRAISDWASVASNAMHVADDGTDLAEQAALRRLARRAWEHRARLQALQDSNEIASTAYASAAEYLAADDELEDAAYAWRNSATIRALPARRPTPEAEVDARIAREAELRLRGRPHRVFP